MVWLIFIRFYLQIGAPPKLILYSPTFIVRRPIPKKHSTKDRIANVTKRRVNPIMESVRVFRASAIFSLFPPEVMYLTPPVRNLNTNKTTPAVKRREISAESSFEKKVVPSTLTP